jgi:hypothetical protein
LRAWLEWFAELELELEYGIEKSKVDSVRSKLFAALRTIYQERDRLRLFKEKETEIVRFQQFAFGATGPFRRFGCCGLSFGETLTEIVEKLPVGKLLFIDFVLGPGHERRESVLI